MAQAQEVYRELWPKFPGRSIDVPIFGRGFVRIAKGPELAPTVVLVHGLTSTAALNYYDLVPELSKYFNVIGFDMPGHGRGPKLSGADPDTYLVQCADYISAAMDALGIKSAGFIGYSMGGPISHYVALRHPEKVEGLVGCATALKFGRNSDATGLIMPGTVALTDMVPKSVLRHLNIPFRIAAEFGERVSDELAHSDWNTVRVAIHAVARHDATPWISKVRGVPAAVVATRVFDHLVPWELQKKLAKALDAKVYKVWAPFGHAAAVWPGSRWFVPQTVEAMRDVAMRARMARLGWDAARREAAL